MILPEDALHAYVRAFESLDPENVIPFYNLPCLLIAPVGVTLIPDRETARGVVSMLIDYVRDQDYCRSEMIDLHVKRLDGNLATLTGTFLRRDSNEQEISRIGFVYIMVDDGSDWKITVGIAHAPSQEPV